MTTAITLWLAFVLACGVLTLFGNRKQAIGFTVISITMGFLATLPLGHPATRTPPPGQFTVLGARIDVDKAIYVLVDGQPEPVYYQLPYSAQTANQLQQAMDAAEGNGTGVSMKMDGEGSPGFAEAGDGRKEPTKQQEVPLL
jgi:hypothetical protein